MNIFLSISGVPEVPNFISLIAKYSQSNFLKSFFQSWENIIFSIIVAFLLSGLFYLGAKRKEMVPSGLQNFLEFIVEKSRYLIIEILGPEGEKYLPFLGTLFLYILSMNLFGLIPFMKSPSASLNITVALAICVFVFVQYLNIKNMGVRGFLYHLAGDPKDGVGWAIAPLMFPIELLTQLSRPVTLSLRLFGNILGEKILIGFFAIVGITVLVFFPIQLPFMFLGLLTSLMQAMVFALLSTMYILLSVPHIEEETHINE